MTTKPVSPEKMAQRNGEMMHIIAQVMRNGIPTILLMTMTTGFAFMPLRGPMVFSGVARTSNETSLEACAGNVPMALPDLIVKELKIVGSSKLRVTVQNQGDAPSSACVLQIKVFKGILSEVMYSTRMTVPAIASHQTKILFFNTKGRPLDGNSIRAMVDSTKVVEEADEDNNEENLITAP